MKNLVTIILAALLVSGCAGHRKSPASPAFVAPSSAPVKASVVRVREHVVKATEHVQSAKVNAKAVDTSIGKAQESVARIETVVQGNPGIAPTVTPFIGELRLELGNAKAEVDGLTLKLDMAVSETLAARAETDNANARVAELDTKVAAQAATLNDFADRNNALLADKAKLTEARDRWRSIAIRWRLIALAAAVAIALYLFRKPLLFGARKLIGLP